VKLDALYVDGVHSFWRLFSLERNVITLTKIAELHSNECLAVKEKIFREALAGNESKAFISQLFDCSGHLRILVIKQSEEGFRFDGSFPICFVRDRIACSTIPVKRGVGIKEFPQRCGAGGVVFFRCGLPRASFAFLSKTSRVEKERTASTLLVTNNSVAVATEFSRPRLACFAYSQNMAPLFPPPVDLPKARQFSTQSQQGRISPYRSNYKPLCIM